MAYAAWLSLAGVLLVLTLLAGCGVVRTTQGPSGMAALVLVGGTLLGVGSHLFSLHHSFLAPAHLWYPAPALVVLCGVAVWAAHSAGRLRAVQWYALLWLPLLPLVCFELDSSHRGAHWQELPSLLQPLNLSRWVIVLVYGMLVLLTRRKSLMLPVVATGIMAVGARRELLFEYTWAHRGWCLVIIAFGLLLLGGQVSLYKDRRRRRNAQRCVDSDSLSLG